MLDRNSRATARSDSSAPRAKTSRDAARTRAKILNVATSEFSTKGFDGARVDRIAARCNLSKNMLYYYFQSKENLFIAVLEGAYDKLHRRQSKLNIDENDPIDSMQQLIHHTFYAFHKHPELIRLLNEENLHKAKHIRRSARIREIYDPLLAKVGGIISRGIEQGIFRKDLDPKMVYLSLSSLAYHYLSNQYTLELALQVALNSDEHRKLWLIHVTDMILGSCRAESGGLHTGSGSI